ncbi:MAG: arsenate reductase (glutaredoxin) [Gammaproteobacteria bacterium]|nr:arsenate reductase (glutaredoxin) [Gammaproteobacteria bacterium]
MKVTIYHNPRCSKSRQTLQILQEAGVEPEVVEYLKTPPDAKRLSGILKKLGITARDLLRKGEQAYQDEGLADSARSEAEIIDAMVRNPILIERPIVVRGDRAVIGRPPEGVRDLLA